VQKDKRVEESVKVILGTGGDVNLEHDGSKMTMTNSTGRRAPQQPGEDGDMETHSDEGSGSSAAHPTLDGSATAIKLAQHTSLPDGKALYVGNSNDGAFYHSTNTFLTNATGDFTIVNYADDKDIIFQSDDGSGGVENYIQIDGSEGRTTFNKNVRLNDHVFLQIGSSADLYLVHSSGDSSIVNGCW
jgi:hypothetical protein